MPSRVTALQRPCGWLRLWLGTLHSPQGSLAGARLEDTGPRASQAPTRSGSGCRLTVLHPLLLCRDLSHSYCEA